MNKKIRFLFARLSDMDMKRMWRRAKEMGRKYQKSSLVILADIIYCGIRYQAGYENYVLFSFAELTAAQRATYVTRGYDDMLVRTYNEQNYRHFFHNKNEFLNLFSDYTHRDWLDVSKAGFETFRTWLAGKSIFFIKPIAGSCGRGVMKLNIADFSDEKELYDFILSDTSVLAEELIVQHPTLSSLYPDSVNTIRIVTVYNQESRHLYIPFTAIRVGNGGVVDNLSSGGMMSLVDCETGIVRCAASTKNFDRYELHPTTGTAFRGFRIPYWNECLALVREAAKLIPQIGYIAWDVAVTEWGPMILEGNDYPGHDIYQMPFMTPDKIGMLPTFQKILDEKLAALRP